MESSAAVEPEATPPAPRRVWSVLAKAALGALIVAALLYSGQINPSTLKQVATAPLALGACLALLFLTIPLVALRWGIVLRALGLSLPFGSLFHFVAIGLVISMLLPGLLGGDAARAVYAWRAAGTGRAARVGLSVVADRVLALLGVLAVPFVFTLWDWSRMQRTPALAALGTSIIVATTVCVLATCALFVAPRLLRALEVSLSRWPKIAGFVVKLGGVIVTLRTKPTFLLAGFGLAVIAQLVNTFAVILIGNAVTIGSLTVADYMLAVPLTMIANALPLTPSGIGVGEAAFDQICRWLEPMPSGVAYSSIFFAFRIVSVAVCIPGLVSLIVYRKAEHSQPAP
jgi:glycosyltransferase 2 family protein